MIKVNDSSLTFDSVYKSDYAPDDSAIKDANLLLVPYHNYRDSVEYCFGEYSEDFLRYIKEHNNDVIKADIAISDEKYQFIEMHSLMIDIGIFLAMNVVLPATVNLLTNYIYEKVKLMHEQKNRVNIRVEIVSQDAHGNCKSIKFDGPACDFYLVKEEAARIIEK